MSVKHAMALCVFVMGSCCGSPAYSAGVARTLTQDMKTNADAVLSRQNTLARRDVGVVFALADRLIEDNQLTEAERYLEQGLYLDSWNLDYQLKYADVLQKLGKVEEAKTRAKLVFENAETDPLVSQAAKLLGMPRWPEIPAITMPPGNTQCVVLVPLQGCGRWILERLKTDISDSLGVPVFIMRLNMTIPEPTRDRRGSFLNSAGRDMGEHMEDPELSAAMTALGLKKENLSNPEDVLKIIKYLMKNDPQQFLKFQEQLKASVGLDPQWNVSEMLAIFDKALEPYIRKKSYFIGVTDADIFSSDYRFLFWMGGSYASIQSYHRFTSSFNQTLPQASKVVERSLKASISSSSYGFGLEGCSILACPRAYPNSLDELDSRKAELCPTCRARLQEIIRAKP